MALQRYQKLGKWLQRYTSAVPWLLLVCAKCTDTTMEFAYSMAFLMGTVLLGLFVFLVVLHFHTRDYEKRQRVERVHDA